MILLDVMLPDLSGIEVSCILKADPELANIFVIQISGLETSPDSQVDGLESGADLYLTKPVEFRKLTAQIHALFRIKHGVSTVILEQQKRELESLNRLASLQGFVFSEDHSCNQGCAVNAFARPSHSSSTLVRVNFFSSNFHLYLPVLKSPPQAIGPFSSTSSIASAVTL